MSAIYQVTEAAKYDGLTVNRKLPDGEWGVYGPAELVSAGATVTVTAANGRTSRKYVTEVVRTSTARGRTMAFGRTGTAPAAVEAAASGGCRWVRTLHDGQWIVMGPRDVVVAGATVTVVKRSGATQTVALGQHVRHDWQDGGPVALAAPAPRTRKTAGRAASSGRGGVCAECGKPRRNLTECLDSSGISGMCCTRCADAPAYERSFC